MRMREFGEVEDERKGLTDITDQRFYANDYDNLLVYSLLSVGS